MNSVSVQTETILSCTKCDYKINDIYEFDAHRWTEHEDDELGANSYGVEEMEVSVNHGYIKTRIRTQGGVEKIN